MFWGEQQATAALVAVVCIFFAIDPLMMEAIWMGKASAREAVKSAALESSSRVDGFWPIDGAHVAFYSPSMIVFGLKILLAIGAGLAMTALL